MFVSFIQQVFYWAPIVCQELCSAPIKFFTSTEHSPCSLRAYNLLFVGKTKQINHKQNKSITKCQNEWNGKELYADYIEFYFNNLKGRYMLGKVLAEDLLEKGGLEMVELRLSSWRWGQRGKNNNMSSVIN